MADIEQILLEFKPTKIFVSHPGDHNSDHKSLYLFLRVILWDREREIAPAVYPYLVHHRRWPTPRGYHPGDSLLPPHEFEPKIRWQDYELTATEIERKHDALRKHRSQYAASKKYLLSFVRSNEIFGDFPDTDLALNAGAIAISPGYDDSQPARAEEVIEEEREAVIGIQECLVHVANGRFVFSIRLSRPLGKGVGASLYVFGYRKGIPFQEMPKWHVRLSELGHRIYDQDRALATDAIKVQRRAREMIVDVPLELLRDPERILTSAHTYLLGLVPLDEGSWRILRVVS